MLRVLFSEFACREEGKRCARAALAAVARSRVGSSSIWFEERVKEEVRTWIALPNGETVANH